MGRMRRGRSRKGRFERIGTADSRLVSSAVGCDQAVDIKVEVPDRAAAVGLLMDRISRVAGLESIAVVGHRVAHGGDRFHRPERITPEILEALRRIVPYDPDHLCQAHPAVIREVRRILLEHRIP